MDGLILSSKLKPTWAQIGGELLCSVVLIPCIINEFQDMCIEDEDIEMPEVPNKF